MKAVSKILIDLVANHGEDILQQPQRLKAMLSDLLPHEKRMRYLLEVSLGAEIPTKLKEIQKVEKEVQETKTNSLRHYFKEEYFLEDNAVKSVFDCWEEVNRIIILKENFRKLGENPVFLPANHNPNKEKYLIGTVVEDIDGNVYKTVQIGNQIWMAENLRVSRYRNGDKIPNVIKNEEWKNLRIGACCNSDYNNENDVLYGKLYNWFAVDDDRGLAPDGWHIPKLEEWVTLIDLLGGFETAGGKLKEKGSIHWENPNIGATNESGFNALPSGCGSSSVSGMGKRCTWWASDKNIEQNSNRKTNCTWSLEIKYDSNNITAFKYYTLSNLFSVRCIKNN